MGKLKINLNTIKSNSNSPDPLQQPPEEVKKDAKITSLENKIDLSPTEVLDKDKKSLALKNKSDSDTSKELDKNENTPAIEVENNSSEPENLGKEEKAKLLDSKDDSPTPEESDGKVFPPTEEDTNVKSGIKLDINSIKAGSKEKAEKEKALLLEKEKKADEDSIKEKEKKEKEKNVNVFTNYESVFKREKFNILEHIKKLKNLPTTNIIFLSILVTLTIAGIGFLFHSNPEIHNLDNYKISLIDTYNALKDEGSDINLDPKKEKINKGGYLFDIDIEKLKGEDIYVYKGKYYENKEDLNKEIEEEIKILKKSKVRDTLKNSFIK